MIVIPAIDLMDGGAVRLAEGDRNRVTRYSAEPVELAQRFAAAGAEWIHVVDLDGAFAGRPVQLELITQIVVAARAAGARIQVGGGLRSAGSVEAVLEAGAHRAVIGTLAVREPGVVEALCRNHARRIVVAIDGRDGRVAVDGWRQESQILAADLAQQAAAWGAGAVLFTDVSRDGMQVGPAVQATAALQKGLHIPVLASGGVGALDDLDQLETAGIAGVVLGRALYEGTFTVEEALARC